MDLKRQVAVLRNALAQHGAVTFDRKDALGRWADAVRLLEQEGFCESEMVAVDEQSTELVVRRKP